MAKKKQKTPPALPVIELDKLSKIFGHEDTEVHALDDVSLTINKGEFVAIMGPSGCGKTTLLNILGLIDSPSRGEYALDGRNVSDINAKTQAAIRANQIGFIFQNFNLIDRMNIIDNVALPLEYKRGFRYNKLRKASKILETFELQEREYYMPYQLSGGQLQRVAIARALVNEPSIILADEPTGNLDSKSSELIMAELSDIHKRGNTIIMVTHNPDLTSYASRVILMKDGRVASDTARRKPTARRTPRKRALNAHLKKSVDDAYGDES